MIFRSLGAEVRDLPWIDFIRAEPYEGHDDGVRILLNFPCLDEPFRFTIHEFAEVRDAVMTILSTAADMAREIREQPDGE